MSSRSRQTGYMDNQMPPILIGILLVVPVVNYVATAGPMTGLSAAVVYLVVVLAFASFSWGIYLNIDSLRYPESPFNKHTSPVVIGVLVAGCLGYSAWTLRGGQLDGLVYLFAAGAVAAMAAMLYALKRQHGNGSRSGLP